MILALLRGHPKIMSLSRGQRFCEKVCIEDLGQNYSASSRRKLQNHLVIGSW